MCRALLALADERRKNQNLEARVEELRGRLTEQAAPAEDAPAPPLSARGPGGWSLMSMLSLNNSRGGGGPGDVSARAATAVAPSAVDASDSPTHGSVADMMMALAETKVTCAEVQGKLTAARRDLARMREVNATLTAQVAALTEERDSSWEEVRLNAFVSYATRDVCLCLVQTEKGLGHCMAEHQAMLPGFVSFK